MKTKIGRPSKYAKELAEEICLQISTTSKGLNAICKEQEISPSSVYLWLIEHKDFSENYARAREQQADLLADEIIEIADTCKIGSKTKETKDGTFKETGDMVDRSRLMVDARKWKASKLAPKKYGDKSEQEIKHSGSLMLPDLSKLSYEQLKELTRGDSASS